MSMELRQGGGVVVLPPSGNLTGDELANASRTRWVWNPYRRIVFAGNTLSATTQIGYRGKQRYTELERCHFYPLGNITWEEIDREAVAERHLSGLTASGLEPKIVHTKYAGDQAYELAESYGESYGLRIFHPGIFPTAPEWVDDTDTVALVAETIQPQVYKLHELDAELGARAIERIRKSQSLDRDGKILAEEVRKIMFAGAVLAKREAEREHRSLIQSMSDAAIGKPGIATPNEFHEWLCDQLNVPVPERVHAGAKRESSGDGMAAAVSLLADERAERKALENRLAALEEKGKKGRTARVTAEV